MASPSLSLREVSEKANRSYLRLPTSSRTRERSHRVSRKLAPRVLGEQSAITAMRGSPPGRHLSPPVASVIATIPAEARASDARGRAGLRIHASTNNPIAISTATKSEIGEVKVIPVCEALAGLRFAYCQLPHGENTPSR